MIRVARETRPTFIASFSFPPTQTEVLYWNTTQNSCPREVDVTLYGQSAVDIIPTAAGPEIDLLLGIAQWLPSSLLVKMSGTRVGLV